MAAIGGARALSKARSGGRRTGKKGEERVRVDPEDSQRAAAVALLQRGSWLGLNSCYVGGAQQRGGGIKERGCGARNVRLVWSRLRAEELERQQKIAQGACARQKSSVSRARLGAPASVGRRGSDGDRLLEGRAAERGMAAGSPRRRGIIIQTLV